MAYHVLSFNQTLKLIKSVGAARTIIVQGENGIGKTTLQRALKRDTALANYHHVDPIDCTQLSDGSIWMPDIDRELGVSRELPNERFGMSRVNQKGINGAKPVTIFLDEIGKARQFIKDVLAPIVYERRLGNYYMPEGSIVTAATNLSVEGLGDMFQPHLKNRLIFVTMRKPTAEEWINNYASQQPGFSGEVIAFVSDTPKLFDSFLDYEDGGKWQKKPMEKDNDMIFNPRASQTAYASPRSLAAASDIVNCAIRDGLDDDTMQFALEGTIGESAAGALAAYIRFGKENPDFAEVMKDPAHARLAKGAVPQMVMTYKLITSVSDRDEAAAATEYVQRMREEFQSLFCNTVANSTTKIAHFLTVKPFQEMLAANRIFFSTK